MIDAYLERNKKIMKQLATIQLEKINQERKERRAKLLQEQS